MSTTNYFILLVIAFVLILIFVVGFNPFAFGDAYFRPRSSPNPAVAEPLNIVIPDNSESNGVKIDR